MLVLRLIAGLRTNRHFADVAGYYFAAKKEPLPRKEPSVCGSCRSGSDAGGLMKSSGASHGRR